MAKYGYSGSIPWEAVFVMEINVWNIYEVTSFGIKTCGREGKKADLSRERGYSVMYPTDKCVQLHRALLIRIVPSCTEMT